MQKHISEVVAKCQILQQQPLRTQFRSPQGEKLCKRHGAVIMAILLIASLAVPLSAQSGVKGKIFVSPAEGGGESAKSYFDSKLPEAARQLGYKLANKIKNSDYYIVVNVQEDNGANTVTLTLQNTKTEEQIATKAMGYGVCTDMDDWNRYLITELMMNPRESTTGEIVTGETLNGEYETATTPKFGEGNPPHYWLYLGLQGAYSARFYTDPGTELAYNFDSAWDLGHTYEAGIRVAGQILPWLAIQAGTTFTWDLAKNNDTGTTYDSLSLQIPLLLKGTLRFGDFLIAPLGGVYYNVALGDMRITTGGNSEVKEYGWKSGNFLQELGWIAGLEFGYRLGPGTLFLDIRYSADFGDTIVGGDAAYRRTRASASLGYDFALFRKRR